MQSVHLDKYMIRSLKGNYVKTDDEGIGYVMFNTKAAAKAWAVEWGQDCYVVKVRAAITPSHSGRTERMVAVQKARPEEVPYAHQTEFRF